MKILLIDDDVEMVDFLKNSLANNSYTVDSTYSGENGSYLARTNSYDVIIFLSMNYTIQNKVACLEAGADDYMTKPFSLEELNARIKALSRRPKQIESSILCCGDILIDTKKQTVQKNGKNIYFTRTEYDILEFILKNKGMILSRGMIMEHVWDAKIDPFSNTIEAHIANIRKKIGGDEKDEIIKNIAGRGYIVN